MSGEPARRTPTGRSLRLVGGVSATARSDGGPGQPPEDDEDLLWLDLPPQRRSVGVGRHWVVRVAAAADVTGMANQVVELLASELLANAVLHGAGDEAIRIEMSCSDTVVRVAVTDNLPQRPVVLHPEPIAPAGRGMAIVEAMSNRWGVDPHPTGGKTVWFEIDLDEY
ncbi:ATP-binding protein [Actinotalea fermentans]|uniref:Histidine kinase/HSP90-like ATPase domain-containing protein n=1 Tax=Actinotalea fermentans TaxID=43671 RepID=A0A511YXY2_9CELL|nr:ATP-binding protein [Actinotalea fermentans]KGM15825.1 hypothetical protein N867_05305 [Actinotalea fermentans ATCC 43279 = JCM 9966 = DSM 3133]GEN80052.1 hypothetical protein AFE02nite_17860 [Actinotalea fermentans]